MRNHSLEIRLAGNRADSAVLAAQNDNSAGRRTLKAPSRFRNLLAIIKRKYIERRFRATMPGPIFAVAGTTERRPKIVNRIERNLPSNTTRVQVKDASQLRLDQATRIDKSLTAKNEFRAI
jgi:hypothetical protein